MHQVTDPDEPMQLIARVVMVNCPVCETLTPFGPSNPYRPFCGERCRLVDLGRWAQEEFRINSRSPEADEKINENGF